MDWVQEVAQELAKEVSRCVFAGWAELLTGLQGGGAACKAMHIKEWGT